MTKRETYISRQARRLSKGQIDRRRFVMSALATGVTLPTAMSLASRAEALTPRRGGALRFGMADVGHADLIDPSATGSELVRVANLARGSCLVVRSPKGEIAGDLAERFHSDDRGTTWVFDLRADVRFHSGRLVTSEDVLASFRHARAQSGFARAVLADVAEMRADGPARLILRLHHPHLRFPALLDAPQLIILPATGGTVDPATTDGTGPYLLTAFTPGQEVVLARNPEDWRSDRGYFDHVHLRALPDAGKRHGAMLNGEVDVIDQVDPRALAMLSSLPEIGVRKSPGVRHLALTAHNHATPHLVPALKAATDRSAILSTAFLGHGTLGADVPSPLVRAPDPDREKAAWHWRRTGITQPVQLLTGLDEMPSTRMAVDLFCASAKACGIGIETRPPGATAGNAGILAQMPRNFPSEDAAYAAMEGSAWEDGRAWQRFRTALRAARASEDDSAPLAEARGLLARHGTGILPLWAGGLHAYSARLTLPDTPRMESADIVLSAWFR